MYHNTASVVLGIWLVEADKAGVAWLHK